MLSALDACFYGIYVKYFQVLLMYEGGPQTKLHMNNKVCDTQMLYCHFKLRSANLLQRQTEGPDQHTGHREVLQFYSNNVVYRVLFPPFSLLQSGNEKHVKSDLYKYIYCLLQQIHHSAYSVNRAEMIKRE